jgi:2-keto-4-pentenoate hydratase/2-oxohepta-3-ene-1,7-dioic acid hydratase in catechol pathway
VLPGSGCQFSFLVQYITQFMPLAPGDVIATGAPPGVGMARTPPVWLKPGDQLVIDIEGIGRLENSVMDEQVVGDESGLVAVAVSG